MTTRRAPARRAARDRLVEHRDERVDALDREALGVHVRAAEEPLQPVDLAQSHEQLFPLVADERCGDLAVADRATEPLALVLFAEMVELVAERAAVEVAEPRDDVGGGAAALVAERRRRQAACRSSSVIP